MSQILWNCCKRTENIVEGLETKQIWRCPPRSFALLTCMDARLDPSKFAGLSEGDAHVIRNAGGRASDDAIRSLVISYKLLGIREFLVIRHTVCGSTSFTNEEMRALLAASLEPTERTPDGYRDVDCGPGSHPGDTIDWLTIEDEKQAIIEDVERIHNHPPVPKTIPVYGLLYNVYSGKVTEITSLKKAA
jgi:carbonic anhydrase